MTYQLAILQQGVAVWNAWIYKHRTEDLWFTPCLNDADLSDADLTGADLTGVILRGANLRRANLRGADLRHAKLYAADLSGADLSGAELWPADLDERTTLPDGTKWILRTDEKRFTDPDHPSFWRSDDPNSPAYRGDGE